MENKNILLEDDMFAESSSFDKVDPIEGKRLSSLVNQLNQVTKDIQEAEDFLKTLKAKKQNISFEQIPEVMDEMGIDRLDVDGATVVTPLEFISARSTLGVVKHHAWKWRGGCCGEREDTADISITCDASGYQSWLLLADLFNKQTNKEEDEDS